MESVDMRKKKYSDVEEFIEEVVSMQELYKHGEDDQLDRILHSSSEFELSEIDLESAAAARGEIKLPEYLKKKK